MIIKCQRFVPFVANLTQCVSRPTLLKRRFDISVVQINAPMMCEISMQQILPVFLLDLTTH